MRAWDIIFIHVLDSGILSNCVQTCSNRSLQILRLEQISLGCRGEECQEKAQSILDMVEEASTLGGVMGLPLLMVDILDLYGSKLLGCMCPATRLTVPPGSWHRVISRVWVFAQMRERETDSQPARQRERERELPARIIACPKTVTVTCTPKPRRMKCCSQISILED